MKEAITQYYQQYQENTLLSNSSINNEKYSRKVLAGRYANLLNKIK